MRFEYFGLDPISSIIASRNKTVTYIHGIRIDAGEFLVITCYED